MELSEAFGGNTMRAFPPVALPGPQKVLFTNVPEGVL